MFRNFLIIALAILTLASCSKDKDKDNNDTPVYRLSAKVDGTAQAFNTGLGAAKSGDATNGYTVMVIGLAGPDPNPFPGFSLWIHSDVPIVAKTYTAANIEASGNYIETGQTTYVGASEFTVTISSITDTEVSGTFSGKVENGSGGFKTISEGLFTAKFL